MTNKDIKRLRLWLSVAATVISILFMLLEMWQAYQFSRNFKSLVHGGKPDPPPKWIPQRCEYGKWHTSILNRRCLCKFPNPYDPKIHDRRVDLVENEAILEWIRNEKQS